MLWIILLRGFCSFFFENSWKTTPRGQFSGNELAFFLTHSIKRLVCVVYYYRARYIQVGHQPCDDIIRCRDIITRSTHLFRVVFRFLNSSTLELVLTRCDGPWQQLPWVWHVMAHDSRGTVLSRNPYIDVRITIVASTQGRPIRRGPHFDIRGPLHRIIRVPLHYYYTDVGCMIHCMQRPPIFFVCKTPPCVHKVLSPRPAPRPECRSP